MKITATSSYASETGWVVTVSADDTQSTSDPAHNLNDAIADAVGALIAALPAQPQAPPRAPGEMTVRERIATQALGAVYSSLFPQESLAEMASEAWRVAGELEKQFAKP